MWLLCCAGCGRIIDPSSDSNDLAPGTVVDMPLWLIKSLAQRNMVQVGVGVGRACAWGWGVMSVCAIV